MFEVFMNLINKNKQSVYPNKLTTELRKNNTFIYSDITINSRAGLTATSKVP